MFNLCKLYKKHAMVKMYPTWENDNHGEFHKIVDKYGKVYQSDIVCKPPTSMKKKVAYAIQFPPLQIPQFGCEGNLQTSKVAVTKQTKTDGDV